MIYLSAWGIAGLPHTHIQYGKAFARILARLILVAAIIFPCAASAADDNVEYQLTRIDSWLDVADFYVVDLDGDGRDDFLRVFSDHHTYQAVPFNRERILGPSMYQGNASHWISNICPLDVDTMPGYEVAVAKKDLTGDSVWLEIHAGNNAKNILCKTRAITGVNISGKNSHVYPGWDGSVKKCYAADLDDDGSMEIIISMTTGFDLYPRGIYVYSYPSGELNWSFPLAGAPADLNIADANNDGFGEIYFKTSVCANGAVVGDRTDSEAYVFSLDHLGNVLWRQKLGDRFDFPTGNVHLCDCDMDDTLDIYYSILLQTDQYDRQIRILEQHRAIDNAFIRQHSFDAADDYRDMISADIAGDSLLEIILDGNLISLDPVDLSLLQKGEFRQAKITAVVDIDNRNDSPELLIKKHDSLYIVDGKFNILCALNTDNNRHILKIKPFRSPFGGHYLGIISRDDNTGKSSKFEIFEIRVNRITRTSRFFAFMADLWPGIFIGLCVGWLVAHLIMRGRAPVKKMLSSKTAQYNNLLTSIVNFNHGRMAGKNLNRLLFLFSNLPESQEKLDKIKPNLKSAAEAYQSFTASQLHSIISNTKKLHPLRKSIHRLTDLTQKLSAYLDNLSVQELEIDEAKRLKAVVPDIVGGIKEEIKEVRDYLQVHYSTNLLRVIPEVLTAISGQFHQQGIGFNSITTRGGTTTLVFFDESEMAAIFEELLSNAGDAMTEAGKKELALDITFGESDVTIRLSDTGHGLPGVIEDEIFNRDFSTRGTKRGYGLYHARQQIERFGGQIKLFDNENGPGATVELILKTVNNG